MTGDRRRPVYIAGPYRGDVVVNVQRAAELGRHAVDQGLAPYVPHVHGFLGVLGAGTGGDDARTEGRAISCCLSIVHLFGGAEPSDPLAPWLWVIARDDGTLSAGTLRELEEWDGIDPVIRTWAEWQAAMGVV